MNARRPLLAAAALTVFVVVAVAAPATPDPTPPAITVTMTPSGLLNAPTTGYCADTPPVPYAGGDPPVTVHMPPGPDWTIGTAPPDWWRNPPTPDPVWQLAYRALLWLQPAAYAAATAGDDPATATVTAQAAAFYRQDPDPGTPAGSTAAANAAGWDEGTSLRRLTTLNCLYPLHRDPALVPLMAAEVAVQVCPRYYGPPCHPTHNHGLMANTAIYRAGALTGNKAWQDRAAARMAAEAPGFFDRYGLAREQSSAYQGTDTRMWAAAAALIRPAHPTYAAAIDPILTGARAATRWLTEPDGRTVQVGGSTTDGPGPTTPAVTGHALVDDGYGWAVGRWSWTDPDSPFYAVRYGPPTAFHGTPDRPGVTWTDWGARVLVEPGTYGSLPGDPYVTYQAAPTSQNVAVPATGAQRNTPVTRRASVIRSTSHAYTFTDSQWPARPHTRYVAVYGAGIPRHRLLVRDTFTDDPRQPAAGNVIRQWWHLDPAWTLASRTVHGAVFRAGPRTLTVASTGLVSSIQRGLTSPARGWHFPRAGTATPAYELCLRRNPGPVAAVVETTFALT